jgi:hypothetical protein
MSKLMDRALPLLSGRNGRALALALVATPWLLALYLGNLAADLNSRLEGARTRYAAMTETTSRWLALPAAARKAQDRKAPPADSLAALTAAAEATGLGDRVTRLGRDGGNTVFQAERLTGPDLQKLLSELDSRGIRVDGAEIKALAAGRGKTLSLTFTVREGSL